MPVAVTGRLLGTLAGAPGLAGGEADTVDQWQSLGHVVAVAAGQGDRERDPARVRDQVMLGTRAGTVNRRGPGVEQPQKRTNMTAINNRRFEARRRESASSCCRGRTRGSLSGCGLLAVKGGGDGCQELLAAEGLCEERGALGLASDAADTHVVRGVGA